MRLVAAVSAAWTAPAAARAVPAAPVLADNAEAAVGFLSLGAEGGAVMAGRGWGCWGLVGGPAL